jgi:hypothetical protein
VWRAKVGIGLPAKAREVGEVPDLRAGRSGTWRTLKMSGTFGCEVSAWSSSAEPCGNSSGDCSWPIEAEGYDMDVPEVVEDVVGRIVLPGEEVLA